MPAHAQVRDAWKRRRRIGNAAILAPSLAMIAACAGPIAHGTSGARVWRGGYALTSVELAPDRPLHESLSARIPGFRTVEDAYGCPTVLLRRGYSAVGGARVFVNGVPTDNRCILRDLPALAVARVEVYPPGAGGVPGHPNSGTGVVLIFLRDR